MYPRNMVCSSLSLVYHLLRLQQLAHQQSTSVGCRLGNLLLVFRTTNSFVCVSKMAGVVQVFNITMLHTSLCRGFVRFVHSAAVSAKAHGSGIVCMADVV